MFYVPDVLAVLEALPSGVDLSRREAELSDQVRELRSATEEMSRQRAEAIERAEDLAADLSCEKLNGAVIHEIRGWLKERYGEDCTFFDDAVKHACLLLEKRAADLGLRIEELETELGSIDVLGNRAALDDCKTRVDKIQKAIVWAGKADACKAELARVPARLREAYVKGHEDESASRATVGDDGCYDRWRQAACLIFPDPVPSCATSTGLPECTCGPTDYSVDREDPECPVHGKAKEEKPAPEKGAFVPPPTSAMAYSSPRFAVGDRVRVLRRAEGMWGDGPTGWIGLMDKTIGQEGRVIEINSSYGCRVAISDIGWWYPESVLEKVEEKPAECPKGGKHSWMPTWHQDRGNELLCECGDPKPAEEENRLGIAVELGVFTQKQMDVLYAIVDFNRIALKRTEDRAVRRALAAQGGKA